MNRFAMLTAAVIAVNGVGFSGIGLAAQAAPPSNTASLHAPAPMDATCRAVVGRMTADAMKPHDLTWMVYNFPATDMERIIHSSTYAKDYGSQLDRRIDDIRSTWQQKYHHDFDGKRMAAAINTQFVTVQTPSGDSNHAMVDIKGVAGQPDVRLTIVRDMGIWSVSVPHSLTAAKLRTNLMTELNNFGQTSAAWPGQEADAYRLLARNVAMAVLDQPASLAAAPADNTTPRPTASASHHWWAFWRNW